MKKLLALILSIMLCLAITACGDSKDDEVTDKNTDTATEESENESETTAAEESESETNTEAEEEKVSPEIEAMQALIPGEWLPPKDAEENSSAEIITFNEDGTASVGDKNFTWSVDYANAFSVEILIKDGESPTHKAYLYKGDGGTHFISLTKLNTTASPTSIGKFYKASEYTKIEITADNWEDYFESKEMSIVEKDAFGDLHVIRVQRVLMLKEEYGTVRGELSSFAMEYSYRNDAVIINTDIATCEYTYGGVSIDYNSEPNTRMRTFEILGSYNGDESYKGRFGTYTASFVIDEFPTDDVWGYEVGFTVLRAEGSIYTYTPAE